MKSLQTFGISPVAIFINLPRCWGITLPVDDIPVHEKVKEKPGTKYGCHNRKDFMEAYYAPNRKMGSSGYEPIFFFERVRVPHVMSRNCKYDMSDKDVKCEGCKHKR